MRELLLYRRTIFNEETKSKRGVEKFRHYFNLYNHDVIPVDRTGTIKTPIKVKSIFKMPAFRLFTKTYEEICTERAKELIKKSKLLNCPIYVLYSGGIDSTLVLVSLIKNSTKEERDLITVLLSQASINENPKFYEEHILGKIKILPSTNLRNILGTKNMLVTGEHNDQIFGSDIIADFIREYGDSSHSTDYDKERMLDFFNKRSSNPEYNKFYVELFEKLCSLAPVKIKTNFDFFWWINFSLKWQNVFTRLLMFTKESNIKNVNKEYIDKYYNHFYCTDDFQLWSMNNMDKKIKEDWKSYKWPCKEIIYNFTKDKYYRDNKIKYGSLGTVIIGTNAVNYIDEDFTLLHDIEQNQYFNEENSFV